MKNIIVIILLISINCSGQKMPDLNTINATVNSPSFIERTSIDSAYFQVGKKIMVNTVCDIKNPRSQSSGIIKFSYYELEDIVFKSAFFMHDTTIVRSILHYEGKKTSDVLCLFNLEKDNFERVRLFTKLYSNKLDNRIIRCWIKRNNIVYEVQLKKN